MINDVINAHPYFRVVHQLGFYNIWHIGTVGKLSGEADCLPKLVIAQRTHEAVLVLLEVLHKSWQWYKLRLCRETEISQRALPGQTRPASRATCDDKRL